MDDYTKELVRVSAELGSLRAEVSRLSTAVTAYVEGDHAFHDSTDVRLDAIEARLTTWSAWVAMAKFSAGVCVLILTLKVGDISALFQRTFHP